VATNGALRPTNGIQPDERQLWADQLHGQPGGDASSMTCKETTMSELKRNMDFAAGSGSAAAKRSAAGIGESQPWRTAEMQQAIERWAVSAEAGFDPYNHVGTRAKKPNAG
jgi:hypothetical protein